MFARGMSTGAYLAGVAFFLPTLLATLAAAMIVVRRRYGYLVGITRLLAIAVLLAAAVTCCGVLPAALGILTRGTSLATALVLLAAALALPGRAQRPEEPRPTPPSGRVSIAIAILALGAIGAYELAHFADVVAKPVTDVDLLTFHLPGIARFIQTGTLWQVDQFLPGFATAQYPNNGDFIMLAAVLPWHAFAFARLPAVAFYILTGAAVYGLALELGATRAAAATFSAIALSVPAVAGYAFLGLPDDIALSLLVIGVMFLVRHARERRNGELVLGALALGLALGTKWFGLTAVAVVVVVWLGWQWLEPGSTLARTARDGALLLGTIALGGGVWLLRNLIESGDPLYPKGISLLGLHLFAGSRGDVVDREGYTLASYLGSPGVLRTYVYPGFKVLVGVPGLVLLAGLVAALVQALPGSRRRLRNVNPWPLLAVAAGTIGICVIYAITPGSAYGPRGAPLYSFVNIRWLLPAIVLGAGVAGAAVATLGRWGVVLELAALLGVADGLRRAPGVQTQPALIVAGVLVVAALMAGAGVVASRRGPRRTFNLPAWGAIAAAAAATVGVLAFFDQRAYERRGYGHYDPVFAWIERYAPTGHRVGLAGAASSGLGPVAPMFGPRLGNQVSYVGDAVRHSVAVPTRQQSFVSELAQGHYDLLMIGLEEAGRTNDWARELGYRLVASSQNLALYAAPRALSATSHSALGRHT